MTIAELLAKNGIRLGSYAEGEHSSTCPRCSAQRQPHNQKKQCLSVKIDAKGATWHCNHCGWSGPEKGSGGERPTLQTYDYLDADGKLLFQKVRNPPGSKDRFYCRRPDGKGGWIPNLKGITGKPLYRWPEIIAAIKAGQEIAIVEGEKDADNLWRLDIPASCNFDGALDVIKFPKGKPKWKAEYSEQLRGADLIVFNDHDMPGHAHADVICKLSHGIAKRVRRLDLKNDWPEIPLKGDVSDWLAGGEHTPRSSRR